MTSRDLQIRHASTYEWFYVKNDLVLSLPQVIDRWHSNVVKSDFMLEIKQKLPTKMYLWVVFTEEEEIVFDTVCLYSSTDDSFQEQRISQLYQWSMYDNLVQAVQYWCKQMDIWWVKISLLSEFRRGEGSSFWWSLSTLLSLFMYMQYKDVDPASLRRQEIFSIWELANKIETRMFGCTHHVSWFLPYVALHETDFPLAYCGGPIYAHERFQLSSQCIDDCIIDLKEHCFTQDFSRIGVECAVIVLSVWWSMFKRRQVFLWRVLWRVLSVWKGKGDFIFKTIIRLSW